MLGLQGVFIKRHKLTKEDGSFYSPAEFSVGEPITIYGRTFFLTDAGNYLSQCPTRHG
jgi:hypothetical protein